MGLKIEGARQPEEGGASLHLIGSPRPARVKRTKPFSVDGKWFRALVSTEFALTDPLPAGGYRLEFEDEDGPGEIRLIPA